MIIKKVLLAFFGLALGSLGFVFENTESFADGYNVTFFKKIVRVFQRNCLACHFHASGIKQF